MAKYDVFISYSRKDTATADRICEALDRAGITYFIDRQGIAEGIESLEVLATAIKESAFFLFLASENAYKLKSTTIEIITAFNEKPKDRLLPYIIDDSQLPEGMRLTFEGADLRTMKEHSIEGDLVPDLLWLLGRESRQTDEKCFAEEQLRAEEFTVNGVSFKMIYVEGGTFQMGSDDSDAYDDEKPAHPVTLSSYHIGETSVTQALWKAVMGNNPSWFKGDNLPVETVSWDDCQKFIQKLNQLTGKTFRLPTEAEWEYAARGGKYQSPYRYAGSNSIDVVAWYPGNSDGKTHPVKTKKPNALGIYDMSGNVGEWCLDWYREYSGLALTDPEGPDWGWSRVRRGGDWDNTDYGCRVSHRGCSSPDLRGSIGGFRLALVH